MRLYVIKLNVMIINQLSRARLGSLSLKSDPKSTLERNYVCYFEDIRSNSSEQYSLDFF